MSVEGSGAARAADLATAMASIEDRIDRACVAAERPRASVTLITVTKFFPAADVVLLHAIGVRDIGESRDQEASAKLAEIEQLDPAVRADLRVHFVGQLQSNKAAHVGAYADVVHSVDRAKVAKALNRGAEPLDRTLDVLLQVDLEGQDAARGGVLPQQLPQLADDVAATSNMRLMGLMTVAPREGDPAAAFARIAELSAQVQTNHPAATWISAGMSNDLEQAIAHGATHLRVGSAILGSRPPQR